MTKMTILLTPGFADWEAALLAASARSYYGVEVVYVSPDGKPVQSSGGMHVTPDGALTTESAANSDALVLVGGTIWREAPPEIGEFLKTAKSEGTLLAAICDATRALAGAGFLDDVDHTANDAGTLDVAGYEGQLRFRQSPAAVRDDRIVTAPGTAPVSFMAEVLRGLGLGDANLDFYLGLLAAEHGSAKRAA